MLQHFHSIHKGRKIQTTGFSPHSQPDCMFTPEHWFQFQDDAAVIKNGEKENQLLLNCFTRWCQWFNMIIRVDKCTTFGIKKFSTHSQKYQPKLFINNEIVPPVITGESFKNLGHHFDFNMSNQEHMSKLSSIFTELLTKIDPLPLHPKNKLLLYNSYIPSQVSWHLTVADLSKTWLVENLDDQVSVFIHRWLDLTISATLSGIILLKNQFGLNLILPSVKFMQCQTVYRNALKSSPNNNIQSLWKNTSQSMNIQYDVYRNTREVLMAVRSEHKERLQNHLVSQGTVLSFIFYHSLPIASKIWTTVQSNMPKNIYSFTIKCSLYLIMN